MRMHIVWHSQNSGDTLFAHFLHKNVVTVLCFFKNRAGPHFVKKCCLQKRWRFLTPKTPLFAILHTSQKRHLLCLLFKIAYLMRMHIVWHSQNSGDTLKKYECRHFCAKVKKAKSLVFSHFLECYKKGVVFGVFGPFYGFWPTFVRFHEIHPLVSEVLTKVTFSCKNSVFS